MSASLRAKVTGGSAGLQQRVPRHAGMHEEPTTPLSSPRLLSLTLPLTRPLRPRLPRLPPPSAVSEAQQADPRLLASVYDDMAAKFQQHGLQLPAVEAMRAYFACPDGPGERAGLMLHRLPVSPAACPWHAPPCSPLVSSLLATRTPAHMPQARRSRCSTLPSLCRCRRAPSAWGSSFFRSSTPGWRRWCTRRRRRWWRRCPKARAAGMSSLPAAVCLLLRRCAAASCTGGRPSSPSLLHAHPRRRPVPRQPPLALPLDSLHEQPAPHAAARPLQPRRRRPPAGRAAPGAGGGGAGGWVCCWCVGCPRRRVTLHLCLPEPDTLASPLCCSCPAARPRHPRARGGRVPGGRRRHAGARL